MRIALITAVLSAGIGAAALVTPAAAVPVGPSVGLAAPADTVITVRAKRRMRKGAPGASGGPSTATRGAPAGSTGGNAATGSGAAPSGK